jgi:hypothetical protein
MKVSDKHKYEDCLSLVSGVINDNLVSVESREYLSEELKSVIKTANFEVDLSVIESPFEAILVEVVRGAVKIQTIRLPIGSFYQGSEDVFKLLFSVATTINSVVKFADFKSRTGKSLLDITEIPYVPSGPSGLSLDGYDLVTVISPDLMRRAEVITYYLEKASIHVSIVILSVWDFNGWSELKVENLEDLSSGERISVASRVVNIMLSFSGRVWYRDMNTDTHDLEDITQAYFDSNISGG